MREGRHSGEKTSLVAMSGRLIRKATEVLEMDIRESAIMEYSPKIIVILSSLRDSCTVGMATKSTPSGYVMTAPDRNYFLD